MQRRPDKTLTYSPSDLTTFLESPFAAWMDRYALEFPGQVKKDETDEGLELIKKKGLEHEKQILETLTAQFGSVTHIPTEGDFEFRHAATLKALQSGSQVIFQAALRCHPFMGYADFLVRVPGASRLGDYHYEAWDSKLAKSIKPYFVVQLLAYSEMLETIQGVFPKSITVILGTKASETLLTENFNHYYRSVKARFLKFQDEFDPNRKPIPRIGETLRGWSSHAQELITESDDLCQVANIKSSQVRKLIRAGITTLTALAESALEKVPDLDHQTFKKLKRQARLQVESKDLKVPKYELISYEPDERLGLRLLPPPAKGDVYFDMEGYPLYEPNGLEYLFGAVYRDDSKVSFVDFWAHDLHAEKRAFETWIDWVYARFKQNSGMHIYHYAPYEVTAMRRLSTQYATRESEVDELLRAEVFVDLYKIVSQSLVVGLPSYSIKYIEHLYGQQRSGEVQKASDSMVEYASYLEAPDGSDWTTSPTLKSIRDYNEADCVSTLGLADWLRALQDSSDFKYVPLAEKGFSSSCPPWTTQS